MSVGVDRPGIRGRSILYAGTVGMGCDVGCRDACLYHVTVRQWRVRSLQRCCVESVMLRLACGVGD